MTLKYRRSILFDQPQQTTAKIALETLVFDYKQRLRINSRTNSETQRSEVERLTAGQARCIEGLQAKLKTISFHKLYKQYHKNTPGDEKNELDPEKMQLFRTGKFYRCSQRPKEEEARGRDENRRREMLEYFQRQPQEEGESGTEVREKKRSLTAQMGRVRTIRSTKNF